MNRAERLNKERAGSANGMSSTDQAHEIYEQAQRAIGENVPENKLFEAELHIAVTNAASEAYQIYSEDTEMYKTFAAILREILKQTDGDKGKAKEIFLNKLADFTRTITFTPHPTFVYYKEAMASSKAFKELLSTPEFKDYLLGNKSLEATLSNDNLKAKFEEASRKLYQNITDYPRKNLTPKQEGVMLVKSSENIFDSIPLIINFTDNVLKEVLGEKHGLKPKEFRSFKSIIRAILWRDQDNKPDVTADRIKDGHEGSAVQGMQRQYLLQLANITLEADKNGNKELAAELKGMMIKIMNRMDNEGNINPSTNTATVDDYIKFKETNPTKEEIKSFTRQKFPNLGEYLQERLPRGFKNNRPFISEELINLLAEVQEIRLGSASQRRAIYHTASSNFTDETKEKILSIFEEELDKNFPDIKIDHKNRTFGEGYLDFAEQLYQIAEKDDENPLAYKLAMLATQANIFGERALGSENRQNRDANFKAFEYVRSKLAEKNLVNSNDSPEICLQKMRGNPEIKTEVQKIFTELYSKKSDATKATIGGTASSMSTDEKEILDVLETRKNFSNMGNLQRSMIIAEFKDAQDFAVPVLFEEALRDADKASSKSTDIRPLIENYDDLKNASKSVEAILKSETLSKHFEKAGEAPTIFDIKTGERSPKTVADMKREKGLKIEDGDESRELKGKITVMFAGSDSLKGAGVSIKYIIEYQQWQIAKICAENGYDVEFKKGNGTNHGRDSTDNPEISDNTDQGIATNNSKEFFAAKTLKFLCHKMGISFGVNKENIKSNVANHKSDNSIEYGYNNNGKPAFEAFKNNHKKAEEYYRRAEKSCDEYAELYNTTSKTNLSEKFVSFFRVGLLTAYSSLTEWAARPVKRVVGKETASKNIDYNILDSDTKTQQYTKDYLQGVSAVEPLKIRAIAFNFGQAAELNHLFYSVKKLFKDPKTAYLDSKDFNSLKEVIDLSTFAVTMASPDLVWKTIHPEISKIGEGINARIKIGNDEYKLNALGNQKKFEQVEQTIRKFFEEKFSHITDTNDKKQMVDMHVDSVFVQANADRQSNLATQFLHKVWKEYGKENKVQISREEKLQINRDETLSKSQKEILKLLPAEVREERIASRKLLRESIDELTQINGEIKEAKLRLPTKNTDPNTKDTMPIIDPDNIYNRIYELVATIKHLMENSQASMIYPDKVKQVEKDRQKSQQVSMEK
jgi:hypothetical protein